MKFNEMKYERPDFDKTTGQMQMYLDQMEQAKDADTFLDAFFELNTLRIHLITMITLAQVRHTIDTSDKFYDEENAYWDETSPAYEVYNNRMRKLCLEAPFREQLEKRIPSTFFQLAECGVKSFDESIVDLLIEENKLASEYGKLKASAKIPFEGEVLNLAEIAAKAQSKDRNIRKAAYDAKMKFYADHEDKLDEIYDKMVKVRTEMAHKLGYKDYVELAYYNMTRLDYDREMVAGYRKQILDYVTPLATKIYNRQKERLGYETLAYYDMDYQFESGNATPIGTADELVESAVKMYHEMSPETADFIDVMYNNELWDLKSKPNKEMGGYETEIPEYHVPFIFSNFNGTSGDVDVLTHEAGHAFQTYMATDIEIPDLSCPTMESAEIDSMSMEFFAYPWMELFFGDQADKYRYSHLCGTITFLPYGVLVDHFQEEVYTHPEMTIEERKECWRRLEKQYTPFKNYDGCELLEKGCWWYQQGHIFQSPFYYIDYTLAQVCAQQFYIRKEQNDEKYWEDYKHLLRLGGTMSFTNLVKEAGLQVPFEEGCIESIMNNLEKKIDQVDDTKF